MKSVAIALTVFLLSSIGQAECVVYEAQFIGEVSSVHREGKSCSVTVDKTRYLQEHLICPLFSLYNLYLPLKNCNVEVGYEISGVVGATADNQVIVTDYSAYPKK